MALARKDKNKKLKQKQKSVKVAFKKPGRLKPAPAYSPAVAEKRIKAAEDPRIYWPDRIDYIRAIAAKGLNDVEMAEYMGVTADLLDSWKIYYPLLNLAIEEGRSQADLQVIQALHKTAIGYNYDTQEVVRTRQGAEVFDVTKHVPGDVSAQKFWLTNRSPHWRHGNNMQIGGQRDGKAADAISVETKNMVIHSILNMITPRPDGDGKAPKLVGKSSGQG